MVKMIIHPGEQEYKTFEQRVQELTIGGRS
jgi:hypothetical protein